MKVAIKRKIKTLYQIVIPVKEIAEKFNITENQVIKICEKTKRI